MAFARGDWTVRCFLRSQGPLRLCTRDERGQAIVEFAVAAVFLMAFVVGSIAVVDAVYMKTVANQAARAAAREIVCGREETARELALDIIESNPGFLQSTRECECEVEFTRGGWLILKVFNTPIEVVVTCRVPVPVLTGSVIFGDDFHFVVSSKCVVNEWNSAIIFNLPKK